MKEGYLLGKLTVSKIVCADINLSYTDLSCSKKGLAWILSWNSVTVCWREGIDTLNVLPSESLEKGIKEKNKTCESLFFVVAHPSLELQNNTHWHWAGNRVPHWWSLPKQLHQEKLSPSLQQPLQKKQGKIIEKYPRVWKGELQSVVLGKWPKESQAASVMALPSEGTCRLLSVQCSAKGFVSWHETNTKKPFRRNRLMGEITHNTKRDAVLYWHGSRVWWIWLESSCDFFSSFWKQRDQRSSSW